VCFVSQVCTLEPCASMPFKEGIAHAEKVASCVGYKSDTYTIRAYKYPIPLFLPIDLFIPHQEKHTHTRTHNQPCSSSPLPSLQLSSSSQSRSLLDPSTHVSIAASTRSTRPNLSSALTNGALPLAPTKQKNKHFSFHSFVVSFDLLLLFPLSL